MAKGVDARLDNLKAEAAEMRGKAQRCVVDAPYGWDLRDIYEQAAHALEELRERIAFEEGKA